MKLGSYSILLTVLLVVLLLVSKTSSAAPRRASSDNVDEDALADGELDPDDIATRRPLPTRSIVHHGRPVLGGSRGSAWVSLLAFTRQTLDERQEIGGFVLLGLPLDRFARASTRVTTATAGALGTMPEVIGEAADDGPFFERAAARASLEPFALALTPSLARSCVAAAWRAAGLGADDARLDAMVARARWSAALPEARLRAVRFEDARLSLDTSTDTSRLRDSAGANVGFEARLTWRFDRLLYADDEPAFERIRLELRDARSRIAAKVLEA
ncbi:MAG TPA: hypothetical protein VM580_27315, partial [Labilithrix sp.]|nr:hypothetical protein [Labilithrix sp.]